MFGWIPTIGVPFLAANLSNGDGTTITVTVTVTDRNGRFSTVIDNSSSRPTRIVFRNPDPVEVAVPSGRTTLGTAGSRRWPLDISFCSA
jgi:hypothetical protein